MKHELSINTGTQLIKNRVKITGRIGSFWDKISEGWLEAWGPHIHHGYYENGEILTPLEAQTKLIAKLTSLLNINKGDKILDAGCGLGGSSIYLADNFNARVSGITLSHVQAEIAGKKAALTGSSNVTFIVEDALSLQQFDDNFFDLVWSLESCEQFYDKSLFVKEAKRVMKENGKLMIATWCSGKEEYHGTEAKAYRDLCLAFDLPYMPSKDYYHKILSDHGLEINSILNWTPYVEKSWDIGISLINSYSLFKIFKKAGFHGLVFTRQLKHMQKGFRNKMVEYMVFIVTKKNN